MIARQTRAAAPRRIGYTLLEMTLALVIALVILGAVYEFLNRQIALVEIGRDLTDEKSTVRRILDRMAADIVASLGGVDPKQLPDPVVDPNDPSAGATDVYVPYFNNGVEGYETLLILSASRVPRELLASDKRKLDSSELPPGVSDLRRISYWYVEDGNNFGLAREETYGVMTPEFDVKPPGVANVAQNMITDRVSGLSFEYFDGASWASQWNSNTFSVDGATPIGPPSAIKIILTVRSRDGLQTSVTRRVVALPAGNNFPAQLQTQQ